MSEEGRMSGRMLTHDEYFDWQFGRPMTFTKDDVIKTLWFHVVALQGRLDHLFDPDDHDRYHGRECRCHFSQCACAYDHPEAVCSSHMKHAPDESNAD